MVWIASITPSGGATSATFSSIPATFTHLQLRAVIRTTSTNTGGDYCAISINSNSSATGAYHSMQGNGSTAGSGSITSTATNYLDRFATGNDPAGTFGVAILDFLDYANTNKNKTVRGISGYDANGSGLAVVTSNLYANTAAISSIAIFPVSGYAAGSRLDLYGITTSQVTGA